MICNFNISFAEDKSYSIPFANIDLTVEDDGSLHVKETIHYHFKGTYNGIYRDIPLKEYENLENINVNISGAYYKYEVKEENHIKHITVFLYSDPAMTIPISNKDIDVTYEYDFIHLVKFYDDIAELQYKLWGEDWDVPVGQVNGIIRIKSREEVKYWINPPYLAKNTSWNGSNLIVNSKSIPKNKWFEVRMIIPKSQFVSSSNGHITGGNGLKIIEQLQSDYVSWLKFQEALYFILPIIIVLSMIYPFLLFRQSLNGVIRIKNEYNGELPENDPPAIINAIYGPGISKEVGDPDINGFIATIMDLINRRYILIEHSSKKEDDIVLKINQKRIKHLKSFEKSVLNFLKEFERNNSIHLNNMNENLDRNHFQKRFFDWRKSVIKKLSYGKLECIFIEKNNNGPYIYGFSALMGSLLIISMTFNNPLKNSNYSFYAGILLLAVSILSLILTSRTREQWTDYGIEQREKWKMFKKYIQNSNSIRNTNLNHLDNYLIYGTALGVGDNVLKTLKKVFKDENQLKSKVFIFHNSGERKKLQNNMIASLVAYRALQSYIISHSDGGGAGGSGGGAGGAGGGSGGGGGGAF